MLTNSPIRRLDPSALPDCVRLAADRDWPPEERKWGLLFEVGKVYGLRNDAGELAASATLTRYGDQLAVISMVLVASRYGRRGLGRRIMGHLLAAAGDATVSLHATEHGQPLYERLGFRPARQMVNHAGTYRRADLPAVSRPAVAADLPTIVALDAAASGADRTTLYRRFFDFADQMRITTDGTGFAATWRNTDNTVIGPVVASDPATARGLINDVAGGVPGPVRLDVYDPELMRWAEDRGLTRGFTNAFMVRGGVVPGDSGRIFAPVMLAL